MSEEEQLKAEVEAGVISEQEAKQKIERLESLEFAKKAINRNPLTTADIVASVKALVRVIELS